MPGNAAVSETKGFFQKNPSELEPGVNDLGGDLGVHGAIFRVFQMFAPFQQQHRPRYHLLGNMYSRAPMIATGGLWTPL